MKTEMIIKILLIALVILLTTTANSICYYENNRLLKPLTNVVILFVSFSIFIRNLNKN